MTTPIRAIALCARGLAIALLAVVAGGLLGGPIALVPLAIAMHLVVWVASHAINVLILGNHGLLVGAETCDAAEALIAEALSMRAGHKVELHVPQRGEKRDDDCDACA